MIISYLCGGLGNQLFQYAAGLSLAKHKNTELCIDVGFYKNQPATTTTRQCLLDHLSIQLRLAPKREEYIASLIYNNSSLNRRIGRVVRRLLRSPFCYYREPKAFTYDKKFYYQERSTFIYGFFQSYRYLENIKGEIQKQFAVAPRYRQENQQLLVICHSQESVFVHIRRGDYISNPSAAAFHGFTGLEYYKSAISYVQSQVKNPYFIFFSDDSAWTKEYVLPLVSETRCSQFATKDSNGLDDFHHMTKCKHAIIANSSFSWWGAWLINNNKKLIVVPKQWAKEESITTPDLIPPNWIQI